MGQTPGYVLDRPSVDDVDQFFAIDSDPRVWTHLPSGRLTDEEEGEAILVRLVFVGRGLTAAQLDATVA
ncbi:MAG: hypothetical protein ACTIIH_11445 [Brevibacterium sp.]|uniref:hypothetical protein n=1 Tax=Brevibacterium sp. TaxID=1701 RepID=UPI003F905AAD